MTVEELVARFPEIPADLHGETVLAEFAQAFDAPLRSAQKPSACSKAHDASNHYYLKLVGPMDIYRYGLYKREKVLGILEDLVRGYRADPEGFVEGLVPADAATAEVPGPGCG